MTGPELNTTNDLLSKLLETMGINGTTATTNHTSTLTVVAYHTGPPHLAGPTAGLVPPGFPPKVHYTPTVLAGPNPTAPYNYNMMPAQSNVTPTGPPSQPTSIIVQPGNICLTALSGQATTIPHAFTTETLRDFSNGACNMDTDGRLSRYKAHLVANGSTQLKGVDVDETFSPIVKPSTIQMVFSLAVCRHWPIHQLDVKNIFLHGDLSKTVYMHQPPGFRDSKYPDHVCLLQRSLDGLKQAPRALFQRFASYIIRFGFQSSRCDSSLFIYMHEMDTAYLLLYVDDIMLTASSYPLLQRIIASLHQEFSMTDLDFFNYFLGISVTRDSSVMFLSQKKYAVEILEKAHMVNCNSSRTPVDIESKLGTDGDPISDLTLYRSLAGSFQYLTFTRPDISYAVQQVFLYMHDPREPHFSALKRVLSAEAEYRGVANVVAETCWLRNLLFQHQRTKHIEIDIHFVRDLVAVGQVRVLHVPSCYQFADIFTKGFPSALFEEFRTSLSVRCPSAPTVGEC
nr:ribonuclease H-like domain-containing protein [Tanacetum cinerariifolium]